VKDRKEHHKPITGGNQGAVTHVTCSYDQQVGHLFNYYPFVDDRLRQLLKEEVMNTSLACSSNHYNNNTQCDYIRNLSHEF
jgi:hypothetical protein